MKTDVAGREHVAGGVAVGGKARGAYKAERKKSSGSGVFQKLSWNFHSSEFKPKFGELDRVQKLCKNAHWKGLSERELW